MSLISARNFIAPFTSTVHLVTLVLIAVLVAFLRLSGGGVSPGAGHAVRPVPDSSVLREAAKGESTEFFAADSAARGAKGNEPTARKKAVEDSLREALEKDGGESFMAEMERVNKSIAAKKQQAAQDAKKKSGALDDIEKRLGIR